MDILSSTRKIQNRNREKYLVLERLDRKYQGNKFKELLRGRKYRNKGIAWVEKANSILDEVYQELDGLLDEFYGSSVIEHWEWVKEFYPYTLEEAKSRSLGSIDTLDQWLLEQKVRLTGEQKRVYRYLLRTAKSTGDNFIEAQYEKLAAGLESRYSPTYLKKSLQVLVKHKLVIEYGGMVEVLEING